MTNDAVQVQNLLDESQPHGTNVPGIPYLSDDSTQFCEDTFRSALPLGSPSNDDYVAPTLSSRRSDLDLGVWTQPSLPRSYLTVSYTHLTLPTKA